MSRWLKRGFYLVLILFIGSMSILSFLLYTTPGLYTVIQLSRWFVPGNINVKQLHGSLLNNAGADELIYRYKNNTIKITHLTLDWQLESLLQRKIQIRALEADTLEINNHPPFTQLHAAGFIAKNRLQINQLDFNYVKQPLSGQLSIQADNALSAAIRLKKSSILHGTIYVGGTLDNMQWTGDLGGLADVSLRGQLKQWRELDQTITWRKLATHTVQSSEGRIHLGGTLPQLHMQIRARVNADKQAKWQLNSVVEGKLPWHWSIKASLQQPDAPGASSTGLFTQYRLQGSCEDKNKGKLTIDIAPGFYRLFKNTLVTIPFHGGRINASLSPDALTGQGTFTIDAAKKANVSFSLPHFTLDKGFSSTQPVDAKLILLIQSLDFLKTLHAELVQPQGQISMILKTSGTLGSMPLESQIRLEKASVAIPKLGLHLQPVEADWHSKNGRWEMLGSVGSLSKKLLIKGQGVLSPAVKGSILVSANDFPIANSKDYQIHITPQLTIGLDSNHTKVGGSILIPYAVIKPHTFTNSLTLSDDIRFTNDTEKSAPVNLNTSMNVLVSLGKTAELTYKGLHATLDGSVRLKQTPQQPIQSYGALTVTKGEYKAYGQNLSIATGQLLFTGNKLDNPGINLRAQKQVDLSALTPTGATAWADPGNSALENVDLRGSMTVGVEVTGKLTDPKIQLFSNPAILSQADILSMLVLGRPANQASKAGAQLLLAAISSMDLGTGSNTAQLLEQLKQNLGFDFTVQSNSSYNAATNQISSTNALVVSKSLSKKIKVAYNVGLTQTDPNVLTVSYLLNTFLSIQISSSDTENGIDFIYTSREKPQ